MTWRRTQSSITKYVLDTERSPTPDTSPPAEDARPSNGPSNRPDTPRTHHRARGLHPQSQSSAPRVRPRGSVGQDHLTRTRASVKAATRAPTRPSGAAPRTCQALRVRPRRSTGHNSPGSLPSPSQESPSQQPRTLEIPCLSGGTSGRCWAASAGSLRAYRRPSGQSLWDSWTPCPTCGVCVTTSLSRCLNGVRDH